MKLGLVLIAALLLAGCGGHKPSAYATANTALLDQVPVYAGAAGATTTASGSGATEFGARDWTLPPGTSGVAVIAWYERTLQAAGWKLTGKSFDTLRASKGAATLSVGVRARTLEVIANSRGA